MEGWASYRVSRAWGRWGWRSHHTSATMPEKPRRYARAAQQARRAAARRRTRLDRGARCRRRCHAMLIFARRLWYTIFSDQVGCALPVPLALMLSRVYVSVYCFAMAGRGYFAGVSAMRVVQHSGGVICRHFLHAAPHSHEVRLPLLRRRVTERRLFFTPSYFRHASLLLSPFIDFCACFPDCHMLLYPY